MRKKQSSPALEHAIGRLKELVSQYKQDRNAKLPGVRSLAPIAGVSYATCYKALKILEEQRIVHGKWGSGIYLQPVDTRHITSPPPSPVRHKSMLLAEQIRAEIMTGVYGAGESLKNFKELSGQYGVCWRTLKAALKTLESQALVYPYRRSYRIGKPSQMSTNTIVLIISNTSETIFTDIDHGFHANLHALQAECRRAGVSITSTVIQPAEEGLTTRTGTSVCFTKGELDRILGFCVFTRGFAHERTDEIIDSISCYAKPVALLDYNEFGIRAKGRKYPPLVRVFEEGYMPVHGELVGKELLARGHSVAAWLAYSGDLSWEQRRLDGFSSWLKNNGGVVHVYKPETDKASEMQVQLHHYSSRTVGALTKAFTKSRLPFEPAQSNPVSGLSAMLQRSLGLSIHQQMIVNAYAPLVETIAANREITAIVGANDHAALAFLELASSHRIAIPERFSLIGFDDTVMATQQELSSYNFNTAGIAAAMVNHILGPHERNKSPKPLEIISVKGSINWRNTARSIIADRHLLFPDCDRDRSRGWGSRPAPTTASSRGAAP
jgi:DNA-binding transcriptional regulator YhcF (GntR family)